MQHASNVSENGPEKLEFDQPDLGNAPLHKKGLTRGINVTQFHFWLKNILLLQRRGMCQMYEFRDVVIVTAQKERRCTCQYLYTVLVLSTVWDRTVQV